MTNGCLFTLRSSCRPTDHHPCFGSATDCGRSSCLLCCFCAIMSLCPISVLSPCCHSTVSLLLIASPTASNTNSCHIASASHPHPLITIALTPLFIPYTGYPVLPSRAPNAQDTDLASTSQETKLLHQQAATRLHRGSKHLTILCISLYPHARLTPQVQTSHMFDPIASTVRSFIHTENRPVLLPISCRLFWSPACSSSQLPPVAVYLDIERQ